MTARKKFVAIGALATLAFAATACSATSSGGGGGSSSGGSSSDGSAPTNSAAAVAKALGIDLSKCPGDPTKKITGTLKIGQTIALSGPVAAAFAPSAAGMKAGIAQLNATSGLGVKIELVQADDQFNPVKAASAAQQLISQDGVSVIAGVLGTGGVVADQPIMNQNCIPAVAMAAAGRAATNPTKYPWTVPYTLPQAAETRIWAESIAQQFPKGAKVAMLYANDASGSEFLQSFKSELAKTKSTLVSTQSIEDADTSAPASQVTTMRNSGANVLISAPTGAQCATVLTQAASQGWKPTIYTSSVCPTTLLDLAGSAGNNVYTVTYVKDPSRPPYNNDPGVVAARAAMKKYAPGTPLSNYSIAGVLFAQVTGAILKQAAQSALGLSKLGILQAAAHLTFQPPTTVPGVSYATDYPSDEVAMESAELLQYQSATKTFKYVKLYNFEGQLTGIASS